jgi:hypothetical protein
MAPTPRHDPLLGYREIAELLGVSAVSLRQRQRQDGRNRARLPEPDARIGGAGKFPVWRHSVIVRWAKAAGVKSKREPDDLVIKWGTPYAT